MPCYKAYEAWLAAFILRALEILSSSARLLDSALRNVKMLASLSFQRILLVATSFFSFGGVSNVARAEYVDPARLDACPGYKATDVNIWGPKLTAKLVLAGTPCNVFGNDIETLDLAVTYETGALGSSTNPTRV